ncbi:hypothetical protein [Qingshengfaniella alkalisoli]|uniref:Uncharacterized protein n=1 Tax=Qingshengfaniella alkalisoli TaxID=2599296 RepID=A0A5B8J2F2_9RHOB|nr:hypothetical protein [Qingshengfaniella alkalisoli]QDY68687.1 hypothetical protein FPZ52_02985 [Qingshengfaniella alkalisoli]
MSRRYWIVTALFLLAGLAPLISAFTAAMIAGSFGCRLDEGNAHPCVILGHDWGDLLYSMGVAFWLFFFTGGLFLIGAGMTIFGWIRSLTRKRT